MQGVGIEEFHWKGAGSLLYVYNYRGSLTFRVVDEGGVGKGKFTTLSIFKACRT